MTEYSTVAELPNFIVLDKYPTPSLVGESAATYQTEADLEREFIRDLEAQGYEYLPAITSPAALLANARAQIQTLNNVVFTDAEWQRFCTTFLDAPGDSLTDRTRKIQENHVYDFTFDDGHLQNIYLVDKENIVHNKLQVINQFEQTGSHANRYDVTLLVNGLPLVHVELKRRGVAIREAFNQVHRYSKESFNSASSLYKYIQIFIISNGTDTRYFANTTQRSKNSFDFTMRWARTDNTSITDLKEFTLAFLQKVTLLRVLLHYSVFDTANTLLVMRPYQIAATERILWKIRSSYHTKQWSTPEGGGFVWHSTGSGKTLTSFKAARLATRLPFIDKVLFVVDRKDLDYQTIKEYQRFSPDSVNGSSNTAGLKRNLEKDDNRIVVTTIQKLNNLLKSEANLPIYEKQVVLIFDECHRSQFGEAQKNIRKKFKKYYQFGFTGTPIFPKNAAGAETTASVFGRELHNYVITDAIRDEKVLKFKVDYNNVAPKFKDLEQETDEERLTAADYQMAFLHEERIREISRYILKNFNRKTHRNYAGVNGFNALLAVSSIEAAKRYYEQLNALQQDAEHPLKIATIYSFTPNEEQQAIGEIPDETFTPTAMSSTAKEFLEKAINDYNRMFGCSYSVESTSFQNYYRDLAKRVRNQDVDLLIVVGMFLTGFDAPTLNTLFVDKNLRYHGLLQAYSRTNRIYDATKTFGNIITFRDLEQATVDALTLFGNKNTRSVVLEKSYQEYMYGFTDILTGRACRGFVPVVQELNDRFPNPSSLETGEDKKDFVKVFSEYLRVENILQNYDEFALLKEVQQIDVNDPAAVKAFAEAHFITPEEVVAMREIAMPSERILQDYRSTYNDIRDWLRRERLGNKAESSGINWDDVTFEVELLKSQEINLDYILKLVFEYNMRHKNKEELIAEVTRLVRGDVSNRAKEGLIVDFIRQADLDTIPDRPSLFDAFYSYAKAKQVEEANAIIAEYNLNEEAAKRYMGISLRQEYASDIGTALNELLPRMSPLNPKFLTLKQTVHQRISEFVETYKGIGDEL